MWKGIDVIWSQVSLIVETLFILVCSQGSLPDILFERLVKELFGPATFFLEIF
jgi:hypothetical protein